MSWDAIGAIGEVIGAVAVVATLGYLTMQTRQSNLLARAAAERELNAFNQAQLHEFSNHADVVRRGLNDFFGLTKEEQHVFASFMPPWINLLDQTLKMADKGLASEEDVEIYGDICLAFYTTPGGSQWFEIVNPLLVSKGRQYVEARLASPDTLPPPGHRDAAVAFAARWRLSEY